MTSDTQAKRWSLRKILLFGIACVLIVFAILVVNALYENEQHRAQTFKRIAAMEVIRARYRPNPELLKIRSDLQDPCAWVVTDFHAPDKNNSYGSWRVSCEVQSMSSPGTRTVVAEWTVDSTLADTPDAGAQKLFIRNPQ